MTQDTPRRFLIVGATSAMAEACARTWAAQGAELALMARDTARLERMAADLKVRGARAVHTIAFDAAAPAGIDAAFQEATTKLGGLDRVLIAHGSLCDQPACERDVALLAREMAINAVSVMALASLAANVFEAQKHGSLGVIGSVAGDRGRQSNYVYGAAKGALAIFLQGLRQRLSKSGVRVVLFKPGFVDTPMTAAFKKGALWATPEGVAARMVAGLERGPQEVYVPGFWRAIMAIIKVIPGPVFNRIKL